MSQLGGRRAEESLKLGRGVAEGESCFLGPGPVGNSSAREVFIGYEEKRVRETELFKGFFR